MNLMIDIGNSQIKYAGFIDDQIQFRGRCAPDEFKKEVGNIKEPIKRVLLSSVRIISKELLQQLKILSLKPKILGELAMPFTNTYQPPGDLGSDRMALIAGAVFTFPRKSVLIIDIGTCITYDFIEHGKTYLGGAISLGLQMRLKALHCFTAKLPLIQRSNPQEMIGKSTKESILSGVVLGVTRELQGTIDAYEKRYSNIRVILTGGDASFFDNKFKRSIFTDSNLLLKGMNFIMSYNEHKNL